MRVLVALSGGVDSAVAAARMVDEGHDVTGVHLALAPKQSTGRGCCTLDDARDARRVADLLGIPYYVWDFSAEFTERVVEDFLAEYADGRTPNPCLRCNEHIKFAALLDKALALEFDAVATGHYARIEQQGDEVYLLRAIDETKDQSYVLGVLTQHQLRHAVFPLGADRKEAVRAEAERRGLMVAKKPDSHDICFIPDGDTAQFVTERIGVRSGPIVDASSGQVLGQHAGVHAFTVGQRRGLGVTSPDGTPRYVIDVDVATQTVRVGSPELLDVQRIQASRATWTGAPLGVEPEAVIAQLRAHGEPIPAQAWFDGVTVQVRLEKPIRGLAAGQQVVLYRGDLVVGSATVDVAERAA